MPPRRGVRRGRGGRRTGHLAGSSRSARLAVRVGFVAEPTIAGSTPRVTPLGGGVGDVRRLSASPSGSARPAPAACTGSSPAPDEPLGLVLGARGHLCRRPRRRLPQTCRRPPRWPARSSPRWSSYFLGRDHVPVQDPFAGVRSCLARASSRSSPRCGSSRSPTPSTSSTGSTGSPPASWRSPRAPWPSTGCASSTSVCCPPTTSARSSPSTPAGCASASCPATSTPPALFMGDAGALLLGVLMARRHHGHRGRDTAGTAASRTSSSPRCSFRSSSWACPLADMAFAFVRRTARGTGFHTPDKDHVHHRLLRLGHGPRRTVVILWPWTALLSGLVLYPLFGGQATAHPLRPAWPGLWRCTRCSTRRCAATAPSPRKRWSNKRSPSARPGRPWRWGPGRAAPAAWRRRRRATVGHAAGLTPATEGDPTGRHLGGAPGPGEAAGGAPPSRRGAGRECRAPPGRALAAPTLRSPGRPLPASSGKTQVAALVLPFTSGGCDDRACAPLPPVAASVRVNALGAARPARLLTAASTLCRPREPLLPAAPGPERCPTGRHPERLRPHRPRPDHGHPGGGRAGARVAGRRLAGDQPDRHVRRAGTRGNLRRPCVVGSGAPVL